MKRILFAAFALIACQAAFGGEFAADPSHSNIDFTIRHLISKVSGSFKDFSGSFSFDEKTKELSNVQFAIQAKSIDTNNAKRDEHLRSPDFFDVAQFATITFNAPKAVKAGKKFKVSGDLSMHGVTKPVTFDMEYMGTEKDPWGNQKLGFVGNTTVKRKDFNITWNKKLDSGSLLLGDDVTVTVAMEAAAKKEEKK